MKYTPVQGTPVDIVLIFFAALFPLNKTNDMDKRGYFVGTRFKDKPGQGNGKGQSDDPADDKGCSHNQWNTPDKLAYITRYQQHGQKSENRGQAPY